MIQWMDKIIYLFTTKLSFFFLLQSKPRQNLIFVLKSENLLLIPHEATLWSDLGR